MARIRNPSTASSAAKPRKRSRESTSPARSAKRVDELDLDFIPFSREISPTKSVHWGRGGRIISGPTITDPDRRSQSPTRSALRRPAYEDEGEDERGYDEDCEHDHHGPSAQLQDDLCAAERAVSPTKDSSPNKVHSLKKLAPSIGTVRANAAARAGNSKTKAHSFSSDDGHVCKQIDELKTMIGDFAKAFPSRPKKARSDALSQLMQPQNEQLARYIGCIATGGGTGAEGWQELLTNDTSRNSVVWGVLGKALKENVFDHLYFGASPQLEAKLRSKEQEQALQDGFYRQRSRSDAIAKQEGPQSQSQNERDTNFVKAVVRVVIGLEVLLLPLWCLGERSEDHWRAQGMHNGLFNIVFAAGNIARGMRRSREVIYYWPPTLKDEEFEPARMECVNLNDMIWRSPYDRQDIRGHDRPILRKGHDKESQAIVRVVCFPGVQAFRQGGGELAKKQLAAERGGICQDADNAPPDVVATRRRITNEYGQEYTGNEGFRTRVISKGVVLLQWGQQRLLTKEAGTSMHIDAVKAGKMDRYTNDVEGHVELFELFEERTSSARSSPVKLPQAQRSPSFTQRVGEAISAFWGTAEEQEEDVDEDEEVINDGEDSPLPVEEGVLPIADFNREYRERQAEKQHARGRVGVPATPRSRKGGARY